MRLQFKKQDYQQQAVESVVQCFNGQKLKAGHQYMLDQGPQLSLVDKYGFANAPLSLSKDEVFINILKVQQKNGIFASQNLVTTSSCDINLDIDMETGTGKTYCYIKTIFELNKCYGWGKFIIVVPSIAIREGVDKNFKITADHFQSEYRTKANVFVYNSQCLNDLDVFASDPGLQVMIINMQAFNTLSSQKSQDSRRIYQVLDDFQSRRPIDVIKNNRPILILDEPQKMEGKNTIEALKNFNPLFALRYSATHKTQHNKVYQLDAVDAFNQNLVKKIAVRGIKLQNLSGTRAYLYLENIHTSVNQAPEASLWCEVKQKQGIRRVLRRVKKSSDLYKISKGLETYKGFIVSDIRAPHGVTEGVVEFQNNHTLSLGQATGHVEEAALRHIQIREAIRAHFDKEEELFQNGIKALSLFFVDEVAKYRIYSDASNSLNIANDKNKNLQKSDGVPQSLQNSIEPSVAAATDGLEKKLWTKGEYAEIFELEYKSILQDVLNATQNNKYKNYLKGIDVDKTHNGYFSKDKKTGRFINSEEKGRGEARECRDAQAYDLILKNKERLLSFEEPVRFIFSHSALREGWDNPNVFVICALRPTRSDISRRQEIGRGMRLCVNDQGIRQDDSKVQRLNLLTVVAGESYQDFAQNLQKDISQSLSHRPQSISLEFLQNYLEGRSVLDDDLNLFQGRRKKARAIYQHLVKNDYIDDEDKPTHQFVDDFESQSLRDLPPGLKPIQDQLFRAIKKMYLGLKPVQVLDDRQSPLQMPNDVLYQKEFKNLWSQMNKRMMYYVRFETNELIAKCTESLNANLKVPALQVLVEQAEQSLGGLDRQSSHAGLQLTKTKIEKAPDIKASRLKYDLVGRITKGVHLTRKTVGRILLNLKKDVFLQFAKSPEVFIEKAVHLINDTRSATVVGDLSYDKTTGEYGFDLFTANKLDAKSEHSLKNLKKHIHNRVSCDSKTEKKFAEQLEVAQDVVVYAKLPQGFDILTPLGRHQPDWAIAFDDAKVKHIYFVAETKGSLKSLELREVEDKKINCARHFFNSLKKTHKSRIKYEVVSSYEDLMNVVSA